MASSNQSIFMDSYVGILLAVVFLLSGCNPFGGFDRGDAKDLLLETQLPDDYKITMPQLAMKCLENEGMFSSNFPKIGLTDKGATFMRSGGFPSLKGWELSFNGPVHYEKVEVLGLSGDDDSDKRTIQFTASYDILAAKGTGAEYCLVGIEKPDEKTLIAEKFDDGWRLAFSNTSF